MQQRVYDAKNQKISGQRAYSDAFNHVLVNMHGQEYGMDLACAIQLRDALNGAIIIAATPDDQYT